MSLYDGLDGPRFRVPIAVAEMTKYVDNSFHALKVTFGNEIGTLCATLGLDSHEVMDIFLADTKLNISAAYLRPGFAFGGSCLPKDVRALTHTARKHDLELPVLANVLVSNEMQIRRVVDNILALGRRKIGIFGLAFKSGTDDLRESPMVELAERLIGKGYDVTDLRRKRRIVKAVGRQPRLPGGAPAAHSANCSPTTSRRYSSMVKSSSPEPRIRPSSPRSTACVRTESSSIWCACPVPKNDDSSRVTSGSVGRAQSAYGSSRSEEVKWCVRPIGISPHSRFRLGSMAGGGDGYNSAPPAADRLSRDGGAR